MTFSPRARSEKAPEQDATRLVTPRELQTHKFDQASLDVDENAEIATDANRSKWHSSTHGVHVHAWFKRMYAKVDAGDATSALRARLYVAELVESPAAHGVVMLLIVANAVVIAVATDWVETGYLDDKGACRKLSLAVLFVFTVEIVAKLFAFHALFFRDGWNVADLLIVAVGLGFHTGVIPHGHTTAVIRLVRILRLTRVVEVLPGLEILMRGFLTGLSSCLWVLAITMLFLFIYAVVGTEVFGHGIERDSERARFFEQEAGAPLDDFFGSLGRSLVTMVQFMTFDSWSTVVRPLVKEMPFVATVYFMSFLVLVGFMCSFMMSAVFTDTLINMRNDAAAARARAHKRWIGHVVRCSALLFTIADEDGSETLDREEILRTLLIIQRRQAHVDRGVPIPNDSLTRVMIEMARHNINVEDALRTLVEWLRDRSELTLGEFVRCVAEAHEPPQKEDSWALDRRVAELQGELRDFKADVHAKLDALLARPPAAPAAPGSTPTPPPAVVRPRAKTGNGAAANSAEIAELEAQLAARSDGAEAEHTARLGRGNSRRPTAPATPADTSEV